MIATTTKRGGLDLLIVSTCWTALSNFNNLLTVGMLRITFSYDLSRLCVGVGLAFCYVDR